MKRGDVYLADLNPAHGSEANKTRPVIVVARNDALEAVSLHRRGVITVVPLTSNVRVSGPMHVMVEPSASNGLSVASKAQAEQIRSIDIGRIRQRLGHLSRRDLLGVEAAMRYHLAI